MARARWVGGLNVTEQAKLECRISKLPFWVFCFLVPTALEELTLIDDFFWPYFVTCVTAHAKDINITTKLCTTTPSHPQNLLVGTQQSAAWGTPDNALSISKLPPIPCNIKIVYGDTDLNIIIRLKAGIDHGGDYHGAWEEIHHLQEPLQELMTTSAPIPRGQEFTLFDYFYVPYLVFEATAGHDGSTIEPRFKGGLPRQCYTPPGLYCSWLHGEEWLNLESIETSTSRQIRLVIDSADHHHPCIRGPSKVLAKDGTLRYFNQHVFDGFLRKRLAHNSWIYNQMTAAIISGSLRSDMRICRLHSMVIDEDRDVLTGLIHVSAEELARWESLDRELYDSNPEMIPDYDKQRSVGRNNRGTLYELAPWSDCSDEQRDQWAPELESLVEQLHAAGLVWDAKPQNVLVDKENRLWLIDFDGGYRILRVGLTEV
ncbi:protein kinase subdomain-containing protein [Drepanopeziza brunnea f. sp. 'multigermtubi' MB_m1]|uniref:Protein kinase subdomain-containing protein n=1 Tax=Marssonina brunnea f. sp. multigermtubi (strain MB_m1) TaxID=1072389 RepID=K1W921_MARBU|nr:protein kinase subdomain-containing protein [Drepanopeziza brunnea f. sp. 'multigermtubi' MB_m1]EKD13690.1 protein kinase subdomain-containing protein [Drepanopeziza brunnea f. sp. 'multigermtubi' MB_m1]